MEREVRIAVATALANRYGVIDRSRALELGMTAGEVRGRLHRGEWLLVHRGVYLAADVPRSDESRLLAATLAAGPDAVLSHRSAAWVWGLPVGPLAEIDVTVPPSSRRRRSGVRLHRREDIRLARTGLRRGLPVTGVARTLADLGEVDGGAVLDRSVDVALARRLVTVPDLEAEVGLLARQGRAGIPALRDALRRRGFVGGPTASVLESEVLRILADIGVTPLRVEHRVRVSEGGRTRHFRLDFLLGEHLALEVDGYAYHSSPEAKAADSARRNALLRQGFVVLEADWVMVHDHPEQLQQLVLAWVDQGRPSRRPVGAAVGNAD